MRQHHHFTTVPMTLGLPILVALCHPKRPVMGPRARAHWKGHLHQTDPHCYWCGRAVTGRNSTLDHVIPLCQGGPDAASNLVLACSRCNNVKGGMSVEQWLVILETMAERVRRYVWAEPGSTG